MNLSDRLRGVLNVPKPATPPPPACPDPGTGAGALCGVLGGEWRSANAGRCLVVERRIARGTHCGPWEVGRIADEIGRAASDAPLLAGGGPARPPFLFFDLETTGLSGGAGTYAFLVGCGSFDEEGGFVTRQYFMAEYADECPLLDAFDADVARAGALVSFNGKSFDSPVLETRYLYHRREWRGLRMPHVDVLHPARRFWDAVEPCSLTALEWHVLGTRRVGDVPGFEIPARYFQFVRSGDARPLCGVLEHNRRDLLSLAGLTAQLLSMVHQGAAAARTPAEALALGRVYLRSGLEGRARDAYERAASMARGGAGLIEARRALATLARRARRFDEAASLWHGVLAVPGCPPAVAREAAEALAIHHEHRVRDFAAAHAFALRSLDVLAKTAAGARPRWTAAVRHRVARIERKMVTGAGELSARLELGD